jgi:transcriptional regulator with XRE-family HTH domain
MSKLQDLRKAAGLSQSGLATASGVNVRTLQDYEQSKLNINGISIVRAKAIADALGVRIEDLIED